MIKDFPKYWPDNALTRNDLLDYAYEIEYIDSHVQKIMKTSRGARHSPKKNLQKEI